ncbi:MAG: AI-2E family transporter [Patescibacteria group bacterium]
MPPVQDKTYIDITTGVIIRILLILGIVWFFYLIRNVVAIVLLSVVIASAVEPAAVWFKKRGIPRLLGVIITYLTAFLVLAAAFSFIVPPLFQELSGLSSEFPEFIKAATRPDTVFSFIPELPKSLSQGLENAAGNSLSFLKDFSEGFFHATAKVFGGALSVGLIVVLSFYLSVQERGIENFLAVITPSQYEDYILDLWQRSQGKIGKWFQGQILMGLLVGVLVYLGLTVLQVRFALPFAVLAAIFELIPIFGPVFAAIPAIIVAYFQEPISGLFTLVLFVIIQQLENHLIYPVVVRKTVGVHPIIVILAMIIGGQLGGFFGILLAVPLSAIVVEVSNDVAARKRPAI